MSRLDSKSGLPEQCDNILKTSEENILDTRAAITKAMSLADLQVQVLNFDMKDAAPETVDELFVNYRGDQTAQRLKEKMLEILEFRKHVNDSEKIRLFFDDLEPRGRVDIQTTPVSFSVDFHHPLDWAQVRMNRKKILYGLPHFLLLRGSSKTAECTSFQRKENGERYDEKKFDISIDYQRAYGLTGPRRIKAHELRHSLNRTVSILHKTPWRWFKQRHETDDAKLVDIMLEDLTQCCLAELKDELSAYIVARNKPQDFVRHFVFPLGPLIGIYNFAHVDKEIWCEWQKHGLRQSVIDHVKKELSKKIDVWDTIDGAYAAVDVLERKGYSRAWAVSFLCAENNLIEDWVSLALACPPASARASFNR